LTDSSLLQLTGESVPMKTVEDLLDLLCYYNSAEPPEAPCVEELHFRFFHADKKKPNKNVWK